MSDSMGRETLEALIEDYRRAHPEFQPPEKSDHPIVLALTTDMNPELIDRCGNIVIFWDLLLDAQPSSTLTHPRKLLSSRISVPG